MNYHTIDNNKNYINNKNTNVYKKVQTDNNENINNLYQTKTFEDNNGTNTNQDTDYNSIKKFKNSFMKEDNYYLENEHKNILQNNGNLRIEDNFSFNNL